MRDNPERGERDPKTVTVALKSGQFTADETGNNLARKSCEKDFVSKKSSECD